MTLRITFLFIIVWAVLLVNPPVNAATLSELKCMNRITYVKIAVSMKLDGYTEKEAKDVLRSFYDDIEKVYAITDNSELTYFYEVIEHCEKERENN